MIFLFPTEMEAATLSKRCPTAHIEICGVGMVACAATISALLERGLGQEGFVLAGIAGSYSLDDVALGEVVEVTSEQICALPPRFGKRYEVEPQTSLRAVSSNCVNSSVESSFAASMAEPPQIENMEGAALFAICERLGINCLEIRAISNQVGAPFEQWSISEALEALTEAIEYHCGDPSYVIAASEPQSHIVRDMSTHLIHPL